MRRLVAWLLQLCGSALLWSTFLWGRIGFVVFVAPANWMQHKVAYPLFHAANDILGVK